MLASKTPAEFEAERLKEAVREELTKTKGKGKGKSKTGKGPSVFGQNKYTVDLEEAELVACDDEIDYEYRRVIVDKFVGSYDGQKNWASPSGRGGAQFHGKSGKASGGKAKDTTGKGKGGKGKNGKAPDAKGGPKGRGNGGKQNAKRGGKRGRSW